MVRLTCSLQVLCLLPLVHAIPQATAGVLEGRAVNCKAVNTALSVLKVLGAPATSFCSAYLRIPSATTTTITLPQATIFTTTATQTQFVSSSVCPATAPSKRALVERGGTPAALTRFGAAQLSSGCSCLGLTPKTTKTLNITPAPTTIAVIATTTICTTCAADGAPCDLFNPGACCGQACLGDAFSTTCIGFF